ncbi:GAF domain-containing protein [candidate division KSB1 bacterium]|nr:GAF domain-containing protein [candidate division KSB1 bacterium]
MSLSPSALSKLLPYIRILILDDNYDLAKATSFKLNQRGYKNIDIATHPQKALPKLQYCNILLTDLKLKVPGWDGLRVCREVKKRYGDQIEVIIYSAQDKEMQNAVENGAIAFLKEPLQLDYLKIWIDEIAKRMWLEKILNAIPDEITVMDIQDFGYIHYVNKSKENAFEIYRPLIGKYCWNCFEKKNYYGPCKGCPSRLAAREEISLRKEWNFISTVDGKQHSVDLHVAPLCDAGGEKVAMVESVRDRTSRMHMQKILTDIERQQDWQKRVDTFLEGFLYLGFERVRFYQRIKSKTSDTFRGIKAIGMPDSFDIKKFAFDVESDRPTKLMLNRKSPLLFKVDKAHKTRKPTRSNTYKFLYKVGEENVQHNDILQKSRWVEIPISANRRVIAKVSADPLEHYFLWSYDIEMLSFYAMSAGQAIHNAQQRAKLNEKTQRAIIKIAQRISRLALTKNILKEAVRHVCFAMDVAQCSIFLLEKQGDNPLLKRKTSFYIARNGQRGHNLELDEDYPVGRGSLTGRVFEMKKDCFYNNLTDIIDKEKKGRTHGAIKIESVDYFGKLLGEPLRTAMFALLRTESGTIGIIRVTNKRRADNFGIYEFDDDDLIAFQALAGQIAIAIENGRLLDEMRKLQQDRIEIIENYSHTLKNRIQPLLTRAELLHTKCKIVDERSWRTILDGFLRLRTVINTMLQLSKAEVGATELNPTLFELNEIISSILPTYEVYLRERNMTIKTDFADKVGVTWDKQMIYDAIANLLDNAIKYGKKGTGITIDTIKGNRRVGIAIKNLGETIPKRDRKKIFQKYYTGKQFVENIVSIGLGLPYVHLICRAHKGRIFYDHRFTEGARFVMILPYSINATGKKPTKDWRENVSSKKDTHH